jgi:hypothetical protein
MSLHKADYKPAKRAVIQHNGYHEYSESGYTLRTLAEKVYSQMLPPERMELDLRCDHLVKELRKLRGLGDNNSTLGIQSQSLREVLLGVYLCKTYQGANMTEIMHSGIMGRERVEHEGDPMLNIYCAAIMDRVHAAEDARREMVTA